MAHILSVHILHCGDETQIVEAFAEHDFVLGSSECPCAVMYKKYMNAISCILSLLSGHGPL